MRVSLILAHPDPRSLDHAIAQAARETLHDLGHDVIWHDLYAERFDPLLPGGEIPAGAPAAAVGDEQHARALVHRLALAILLQQIVKELLDGARRVAEIVGRADGHAVCCQERRHVHPLRDIGVDQLDRDIARGAHALGHQLGGRVGVAVLLRMVDDQDLFHVRLPCLMRRARARLGSSRVAMGGGVNAGFVVRP
ncbi:MAG: NAD(P)H-dependent oxidoreductase [Chloroflexota bacterium]